MLTLRVDRKQTVAKRQATSPRAPLCSLGRTGGGLGEGYDTSPKAGRAQASIQDGESSAPRSPCAERQLHLPIGDDYIAPF